MKMLNEREIGRLKQDILRLENEITDIKDRKSGLTVKKKIYFQEFFSFI
jgi:hypothetical protein